MSPTTCVDPSAVRIWRGTIANNLSQQKFLHQLGTVFVPLTPQMQSPLGLTAYLPTILPAEKPSGLPDEIALVFYKSQQTYENARKTIGGRAYGLLHGTVFEMARSKSSFPVLLCGPPELDRAYYLIDRTADWYHGNSRVLVVSRRQNDHADVFIHMVRKTVDEFRTGDSPLLHGLYFFFTSDYLLCWEHHADPCYSFDKPSLIDALAPTGSVILLATQQRVTVSPSMHAVSEGLDLHHASHLNVQFNRLPEGATTMTSLPPIYGLHGHAHGAPADTLEAYWAALGAGAAGFIAGVQMSLEGTLFCAPEDMVGPVTSPRRISAMTDEQMRTIHPGLEFRVTHLDENHRETGKIGTDTPWSKVARLRHPTLREVLQLFGRRAKIMLRFSETNGERLTLLLEKTVALLAELGLTDRVQLIGNSTGCGWWRENRCPVGYIYSPAQGEAVSEGIAFALMSGVTGFSLNAEQLTEKDVVQLAGNPLFLGSSGFCPPTDTFRTLAPLVNLKGLVAKAVDRAVALITPPALILKDDFAGTTINEKIWACGYSHNNRDTAISQNDGLTITIQEGGSYSGAGALTLLPIHGDFDAQIDFQVAAPQQGTTFELAAITIDPGYHYPDLASLKEDKVNLTFDVHGAPPYASSERDEADGFRIGWNNGHNLTKIDPTSWAAASSNMYNKYGRDVGNGDAANPTGSLRLRRHGSVFTSFYKDKHNTEWVCSGAALVHNMADEVFLRLAAKHWQKKGIPPANTVVFRNFRLYQF